MSREQEIINLLQGVVQRLDSIERDAKKTSDFEDADLEIDAESLVRLEKEGNSKKTTVQKIINKALSEATESPLHRMMSTGYVNPNYQVGGGIDIGTTEQLNEFLLSEDAGFSNYILSQEYILFRKSFQDNLDVPLPFINGVQGRYRFALSYVFRPNNLTVHELDTTQGNPFSEQVNNTFYIYKAEAIERRDFTSFDPSVSDSSITFVTAELLQASTTEITQRIEALENEPPIDVDAVITARTQNDVALKSEIPTATLPEANVTAGINEGDEINAPNNASVFNEFEDVRKSRILQVYNHIYNVNINSDFLPPQSNPNTVTLVENNSVNNKYPTAIEMNLTPNNGGSAIPCDFTFISKKGKVMTYAFNYKNYVNGNSYLKNRFIYFNQQNTSIANTYTHDTRQTVNLNDVLISNSDLELKVIDKSDFVVYFQVTFFTENFVNFRPAYVSSNSSNFITQMAGIALFDKNHGFREITTLQTDASYLNPYKDENKGLDVSLGNIWNEDKGYYDLNIIDPITFDLGSTEKIFRGFRDADDCDTDILTENPFGISSHSIFKKFSNFTQNTLQIVQRAAFENFFYETAPTSCSLGFWLNSAELNDFLLLTTVGPNRVYIPKKIIGLGVLETSSFDFRITDQKNGYVFINFINKVGISTSIGVGLLSGSMQSTSLTIGGMTMVEGEHKLQGVVKYKSVSEKNQDNLTGKSVCVVGDSTTAGLALPKRFGASTGLTELWLAAVSGSGIGNSLADNWIYNYRDFVIKSGANLVLYNISSNDAKANTGTMDDVDNDSVENSYFKYYFQFLRYILQNENTIAGTSNLNLKDSAHFICSWLTGDDSVDTDRRIQMIEKRDVADYLAKYWSLGFIDIHRFSGWNVENSTTSADGTHPFQDTHSRISSKIIKEIGYFFRNDNLS